MGAQHKERLLDSGGFSSSQYNRPRLRLSGWFAPLRIPLGRNSRRELVLPVLKLLHPSTPLLPFNRLHKRRDSLYQTFSTSPFRIIFALVGTSLVLALPLLLVLIFLLRRRSTLVFSRAEIERIWRWEIASGHYPSRRDIGIELGKHSHAGAVVERVENPGLPMGMGTDVSKGGSRAVTVPVGAERYYLLPPGRQGGGGEKSYPPRPKSGSALDLDEVMNHCDFSERKYVRDCLEVLAVNAGLKEQGAAVTLGRTTFISDGGSSVANDAMRKDIEAYRNDISSLLNSSSSTFSSLLATRQQLSLSAPPTDSLVPRTAHPSHPTADPACDPDYPKLMHIFWAGPFTDKPYAAALSFLYTQNLSLDVPFNASRNPSLCRPQLWIWINPGSASSLPNDHANEEMHEELSGNPWSAPLLNSRFEEVVKFKLWNTTEQLDDVKEMEGWRDMKLFNSHGKKYDNAKADPKKPKDKLFSRVGSSTSSEYDRLSVVLSDMARFVLTHRYGGIYLDADTILLRDWEELFGWHGSFAYRWSRLLLYNTAVLKMQRGSAIGHFVFRTAVNNGLDFHPMTVSRYTEDAGVEELLLRLPDALFDSAWLNTEYYQRDRPALPYFERFKDFFETPKNSNPSPAAAGFDGFFQGAFSYHYHNFWWLPFDPTRNFSDLGPRFLQSQQRAHTGASFSSTSDSDESELSWATMLKRTFEAYLRGDAPNLYGEWISWD